VVSVGVRFISWSMVLCVGVTCWFVMDFKLLAVVVLIAAAGFVSGNYSPGSFVNNFDVSSASIQDLDLNGSNYVGESTTVSGLTWPESSINRVNGRMEDDAGYSVYLGCSDYINFDYSTKYKVSGVVKQKSITEYDLVQGSTERTITYIDCTSPPS